MTEAVRLFPPLDESNAPAWCSVAAAYARQSSPPKSDGRGIAICAGGMKYFPPAWVTINALRHFGCTLPIQVWHLGPNELTTAMRNLLRKVDAQPVDGRALLERFPHKRLNGWELKCYAILHCPWKEVMLLDADCTPVENPEPLFRCKAYRGFGSLFWPDISQTAANRSIWRLTGVPDRNEPEFESGQIVVDKSRNWRELILTNWFNEESAFWYRHIHGDKDTFRFAWHLMGTEYGMIPHPQRRTNGTVFQHHPTGRVLFQHGSFNKWRHPSHDNTDKRFPGYRHYELFLGFARQLDGLLDAEAA
jgi:hypothetical protein